MAGRDLRTWCAGAVVVLAVFLAAASASAHTSGPTAVEVLRPPAASGTSPAHEAPSFLWTATPAGLAIPAMVLVASLLALTLRRPRRIVAFTVAVVLVLFAYEASTHSVHHLGDHQDRQCVVASAATHLAGVDVAPVSTGVPPRRVDGPVSDAGLNFCPSGSLRPATGRAPPAA